MGEIEFDAQESPHQKVLDQQKQQCSWVLYSVSWEVLTKEATMTIEQHQAITLRRKLPTS